MNIFKIFVIIIFIALDGFCQNTRKLDSLLKVLPALKEDTSKVKTLVKICNVIVFSDPKQSLQYGNQSLALSQNLKWKKGVALSYAVIGDAYENQGNDAQALETRFIELEKWKELNNRTKICGVLGNIGVSYSNLDQNLKALQYYISALEIAEEIDNKKVIVNTQINIAVLNYEQKKFNKAREYYYKALKIAESNNLENAIAIINNNLGLIYNEEDQYSKAIQYFSVALKISEKLNRKMQVAYISGDLGHTYSYKADSAMSKKNVVFAEKNYSIAIEFYKNAYSIAKEMEIPALIADFEGNIGRIYIKQKNYEEAKIYLQNSIETATKTNAAEVLKDDHFRFYELNKETKNPSEALVHYERYSKLKDSISGAENKKLLSELNIKYETEKKESENIALGQQNRILELSVTNSKFLAFGLTITLILVLSIAFLIVRQNKLRSKQENIRLEQKLLRTQMNPHFIFNSLSGIESFIYEHQPKEAGNYLSQFARLMRLILENSDSEYISLDKEIETLNYYLSLQKLRLNDNLKYSIEVDPSINASQIFIPPMLTQPFLENAIEHGFRGLKECGEIYLSFKLKDDYLEIKITDNGVGFAQAQQQKDLYKEHKSMAMQITYERLRFLNKSKKQKLFFSIKELAENDEKKGTEVLFSIPV